MESSVALYTVVFIFYSCLEVTGSLPQEIRSAGLTLTSFFSRYYGDEELDFVNYYMKKTTAAIIIHSFLPLLYTLGLQLVYPHFNLLFIWSAPPTIQRLLLFSIVSLLAGVAVGVVYSRDNWSRHPLARVLSKYGQNWRMIVATINNEYRRVDKFISDVGRYKIIVTDSWIIKCSVHSVQICRQSEANLKVVSSDDQRVQAEGRHTQFLTIEVSSNEPHSTSFKIRLKSEDYSNLREKLTSPIQVARQVVIRQSLSDQFLAAFSAQVARNGVYHLPPGSPPLEPCLGCSQAMPEVKLQKTCAPIAEGPCQSCQCRPMWCLSCMGKWFVSRQDQSRPDTWMASSATCPLCRQTFCMLDVLQVDS